MKPPFRYFGGKQQLAEQIVGLFPPHRTYVEPFAGSAAVLFAKPRVPNEVLNDLSGDVVTFFRVLREQTDDLVTACQLTPYAREEFLKCRDHDASPGDDLERARRFFVRVQQSFGGSTRRNTGWATSVRKGSNRAHTTQRYVDEFLVVAERLAGVILDARPATKIIDLYGVDDAVIYADPPYLGSSRTPTGERNAYDVEMTDEEAHTHLAAALWATPATVFLSGYDSKLYRDLYDAEGWDRLEIDTISAVAQGTPRTEVIWSNRPIRERPRQEALL